MAQSSQLIHIGDYYSSNGIVIVCDLMCLVLAMFYMERIVCSKGRLALNLFSCDAAYLDGHGLMYQIRIHLNL